MFGLAMGRMGSVGGQMTDLQRILALPGMGPLWDFGDMSTLYQDSAGTTPVTAYGQPVGLMLDKSGKGNHLSQATTTARPILNSYGSVINLEFDGIDDGLSTGAVTLGADMDCFIAVRRYTPTSIVMVSSNTFRDAPWFGVVSSHDGISDIGSGSPRYYVDGIGVNGGAPGTTRGQLHAALTPNIWHILEVRNLNLASGWGSIGIGAYENYRLNGGIASIILCPAQSPENRTLIRRYLGAKVGLSL